MTEKKAPKKVEENKEEVTPVRDLNIYQKLHYAQSICEKVSKEQTGMGYSAGSYNDVQQVVKDACINARLLVTPQLHTQIENDKIIMNVSLVITDIDNFLKDEHGNKQQFFYKCGDIAVTQTLKGNQNDAKASGSLFSYGYKYLLQKFFLLNIEESQDLDFEQTKSSSTDGFDLNKLK